MDFFLLSANDTIKANTDTNKENTETIKQETSTFMNSSLIKRGDYVKIIYKPNGRYNTYKGYIGEVREYRKDRDFAMVILHAMVNMKLMRIPIDHFIKIDY